MKFPGGRLIEEILNEISLHVDIIKRGVDKLVIIIEKYDVVDYVELEKLYNELSLLENQGDDLKLKTMNTLRTSHIHPEDREDLLRLVLDIDEVIGIARAVAKKLLIFKHLEIRIPTDLYELLKSMIRDSVVAVERVNEMINAKSHDQVFEIASFIEKYEKEVDDLRIRALEIMYEQCLTEYKAICIALPTVIDDIELITDLCEDIADIYRLYAISR